MGICHILFGTVCRTIVLFMAETLLNEALHVSVKWSGRGANTLTEFCRSEVQIDLRRGDTFVSSKERDIIERKSTALQHPTPDMTTLSAIYSWKFHLLPHI